MSRIIEAYNGNCCIALDLDKFFEKPSVQKARKLFKLICTGELYRNMDTIIEINRFLPEQCAILKTMWANASTAFTDGYRDPMQNRHVEAQNNKLKSAVVSAKHKYEAMCAISDAWYTIKVEYDIITTK